jgi:hypothetical protein
MLSLEEAYLSAREVAAPLRRVFTDCGALSHTTDAGHNGHD